MWKLGLKSDCPRNDRIAISLLRAVLPYPGPRLQPEKIGNRDVFYCHDLGRLKWEGETLSIGYIIGTPIVTILAYFNPLAG